ncbi:C40 family peptidase [Flavobacterium litorale]|uniref:C40 family peptidase n=1 Tax=Flavobacterium litorale TaxID=2856519 RepID=A0ABX8VE30_9FLAO|nr:C40 family peptidase [Flavobacterium litorale]QYJ69418.1 C40 family peptidase [Flavobacterium litorale]
MKILLSISFLALLLVSWKSSAQITTSKQEAIDKGLYSYTEHDNGALTEVLDELSGDLTDTPTEGTSGNTATVKQYIGLITDPEPDPDFIPAPDESYLIKQLVYSALEFEGAKYRRGGTTQNGVDCSGMIYTTFNTFNIVLPRTSREMARMGEKVKLKKVKKGDLLFFDNRTSRKNINHVGLVIEVTPDGEIKFLHATLHLGVTVSSMNEAYYKRNFVQANRIIAD